MFIHECTSARDLLANCERIALNVGAGGWFFRGQADSTWTLVPSLLRPGAWDGDPQQFERDMLEAMRKMLRDRSVLPERLIDDADFVLALAQHYGVKTRMLDWTRDPAVALYFAASDALRTPPKSGRFSVFALGEIYVQVGQAGGHARFVVPPRAANANLAAQRGLLVRHDWSAPDLWDPSRAKPTDDPTRITAEMETRLVRLDAPAADAPAAINMLLGRGVDASVIFPTEHGIARFGEDMARLDVLTRARVSDPTFLYVRDGGAVEK